MRGAQNRPGRDSRTSTSADCDSTLNGPKIQEDLTKIEAAGLRIVEAVDEEATREREAGGRMIATCGVLPTTREETLRAIRKTTTILRLFNRVVPETLSKLDVIQTVEAAEVAAGRGGDGGEPPVRQNRVVGWRSSLNDKLKRLIDGCGGEASVVLDASISYLWGEVIFWSYLEYINSSCNMVKLYF